MPVGISSAARNLFLLGSSGADVVTNFFKAIDQSSGSDDGYVTTGLGVGEVDVSYLGQSNYNEYHLSGTKTDPNSKIIGWVDKRQEDGTLDWNVEVNETTENNVLLNDLYLDANHTGLDGDHEVIVCGGAGSVPFVSKYDKDGVVIWSATSQTGDVTYNGVTSSSKAADSGNAGYEGDVYACGNTDINGSSYAVVEKFNGATGIPGWGKRFSIEGADVVLHAIDTQPLGEYVVAGGYLQDINNNFKGYFVKIDTVSGDVIWDRTLELTDRDWGTVGVVEINDVCVDDNGFIYVVGSQFNGVSGLSAGFICKYTEEGNMLWQKETVIGGSRFNPSTNTVALLLRWRYNRVKVDTQTGQIIILGSYHESSTDEYGVLIKYSSSGKKIFERIIESTEAFPPEFGTLTHPQGGMALDADPSFYYVLFTDQELNTGSQIPNKYTFGKVSSSGNGLGAFSYDTGDTNTIEYLIHDIEDRIGRLSDGSVRNDTSDLATNILNPTKIMFDDLATPITNKKRQMDRAGDFVISGSPAVRIVDFQELNLLGNTGRTEAVAGTHNNIDPNNSQNYSMGTQRENDFRSQTVVSGLTGFTRIDISTSYGWSGGNGGSLSQNTYLRNSSNTTISSSSGGGISGNYSFSVTGLDPNETYNIYHTSTSSGSTGFYEINASGTITWDGFETLAGTDGAWLDQSGKGNNAVVLSPQPGASGPTANAAGYWEFDGTDDYITLDENSDLANITGDISIEAWFNIDTTNDGNRAIWSKGRTPDPGGGTQTHSLLWVSSSNTIGGLIGNLDGSASSVGQTIITAGQWYHVVLTSDGSNNKIYINGVLDDTNARTSAEIYNTNQNGGVSIGRDARYPTTSNRMWDGKIGEVRVYPRALTAAQVFQNYNATKSNYIAEPPDTAPKIGPGILYNGLVLNYDFGNRATFDNRATFYARSFTTITATNDLSEELLLGPSANDHYGTQIRLTDSGKMLVSAVYNYFYPAYVYDFADGTRRSWASPADHGSVADYISAGSGRVAIAAVDRSSGVFADYVQKIYVYDEDFSNEVIIDNGKNMQTSGPHRIYKGKLYAAGRSESSLSTQLIKVYDVYTGTKLDEFSFTGYGSSKITSMAIGLDKLAIGIGDRKVLLMDLDGSNLLNVTPTGLTYLNSDYGEIDGSMAIGLDQSTGTGKLYVGDGQYNNNAGRVYSWNFDGTASTTIEAPNSEKRFGQSVAVDNGILVIGSPNNETWTGSEPGLGNVYVVDSLGAVNLTPSVGGADGNEYGCAVDIKDNRIVVGARNYAPFLNGFSQLNTGAVYSYKKGFPLPETVKNLSSSSYPSTIDGAEFNNDGYFVFDNANNDEIISSQTTVADTGMSGMTLEVWANLSSSTVFGTGGTSWVFGEEGRYRILYTNGSLIWVCATANNGWYTTGTVITASGLSILDSWHHIVGVYDGTNIRLDLDGTTLLTSTDTISGNVNSAGNPQMSLMGTDAGNVGWGTGSIGQVRIYNRALTTTEVSQNYNATRAKYGV